MKEEKTSPKTSIKKPEKNHSVIWFGVIIVILLIAGSSLFLWQMKNYNNQRNKLENEKKELQKKVDDLAKQLKDKSKELEDAKKSSTPSKVTIPQNLKDNIEAALNTKNTAALEGYMASSVNVVVAASEKAGPRTPAQAVSDLDYLNSATSPWNFNLPQTTLTAYKNSFYGQYFGDNTVVGQSTNKYVASFGIDANVKINVIFMAVNADLLQ
ncbi:MAG: hypothetical protein Q8P54_00725 [bacterium]|nr:hypothetical protein [bacterium]